MAHSKVFKAADLHRFTRMVKTDYKQIHVSKSMFDLRPSAAKEYYDTESVKRLKSFQKNKK